MSSHGPVIQYCASLMAGTKRRVLHPLPKTQLRHSADEEGTQPVGKSADNMGCVLPLEGRD